MGMAEPTPGRFDGLTAILPMKGASQRVPGKNARVVGGRPLFHWMLETLRATRAVDRIVVETDSDALAEGARALCPDIVLLRRPEALRGHAVSMNTLLAWHLAQLDGDRFLQVHATTPLLSPATLERAAATLAAAPEHDSLFGVTRRHARLYWPDGRAINHDPERLIQTQDLPPVFEENSTLYLFSRDSFAAVGRRIGARPLMFETPRPESWDIDDKEDLTLCDALLRRPRPDAD